MFVLDTRNVNQAYAQGMTEIRHMANHKLTESRNGPVYRAPFPVTTIYRNPCERVLFDFVRDANPFFHLLESLWMLAGRNDVAWITQFNSSFSQFSDDGVTFNGAYGYRWRTYFNTDQVAVAIKKLKENPWDRQVYIAMWDGFADLTKKSKDIPCNLGIKFAFNDGKLDMMVTNRSNDIIWGAYGANCVHMSILQEYVAAMAGIPIGKYYQISMDYHAYKATFDKHWHEGLKNQAELAGAESYPNECPLVENNRFAEELTTLLIETDWSASHHSAFTNRTLKTAALMVKVWQRRKLEGATIDDCVDLIDLMPNADWRMACRDWVLRRRQAGGK